MHHFEHAKHDPAGRGRGMLRVAMASAAGASTLLSLLCATAWLLLGRAERFDLTDWLARAEPRRVRETGRETPGDGTEIHRVSIEDPRGGVPALVRLPIGMSKPMPGLVILGGLRTGRQAVRLIDPTKPIVVASRDYAYEGPRALGGLAFLGRLPEIWRSLLRTAAAYRELAREVAALPQVDRGRVFLLGASLGVPLTSAIAVGHRPAGVILLYGFSDHATLMEDRLRPYVHAAWLRRRLARWGSQLTSPFDAARALPRLCGTPLLVMDSPEDRELPAECTAALWRAACEPKTRIELPGGHLRPRRDDLLRQVTDRVYDWLVRQPASARVRAAGSSDSPSL